MRRTVFATLATTALAGLAGGVLAPAPAQAMLPAEATALSTLRADTVQRAKNLLANPQDYRSTAGGVLRHSVPAGATNPLEYNGSNANLNEFNDYNGQAWCGYFAARTWTGQNTPSPADFPRIPTSYASSQAWRTDSGDRYHRFNESVLPVPADVLVWQDGDAAPGQATSTATGHVGVVISVDAAAMTVTTIEGNVNGDEIARRTYAWDADGPTLAGKHFMGYVDRE